MIFDYSGRLYTFGCSMTQYYYPTWADILGREFSYYENWGNGGRGNLFIFNSVIECLARNKITEKDTIIVMWSAISRFDYYKNNNWCIPNKDYPVPEHFICPHGSEVRDYAYFYALYNLLESKNINFKFLAWHNYNAHSSAGLVYQDALNKIITIKFGSLNKQTIRTSTLKLQQLYDRLCGTSWPTLTELLNNCTNDYADNIKKEIEEFYTIINKHQYYYIETPKDIDKHPGPLQHLAGLKDAFPNLVLSDTTTNWITEIDNKVQNSIPLDPTYYFKNIPKERL